jgi:hypothetical protein
MARRSDIDYTTNHPIHDAIFGDNDDLMDDTPRGADHDSVRLRGAASQPGRNQPMRALGDTDSSDRQPLGDRRN